MNQYDKINNFIKSRTRDGTVKCLGCSAPDGLIAIGDRITCTKCGAEHTENSYSVRYSTKELEERPVTWNSYNDNKLIHNEEVAEAIPASSGA